MGSRSIVITAGSVRAEAVLWDALPIDAKAETWGDEIRPASAVNVRGRVTGDPRITIERST